MPSEQIQEQASHEERVSEQKTMQRYSYDAFYKTLFENPDIVALLVQHFIPETIAKDMDLSALTPYPTEYIAEDLKTIRRNDCIWRIKWHDSECYLLLMLEFQSSEDWWMATRIQAYTSLLWQKAINTEHLHKHDKLPPIFPIVLYNGKEKWTAPQDIFDLVGVGNEDLKIYQPHQRYFLLDELHLSQDILQQQSDNVLTQVIKLERVKNRKELKDVLDKLIPMFDTEKYRRLQKLIADLVINGLSVRLGISTEDMSTEVQGMFAAFEERMAEVIDNEVNQAKEQGWNEGRNEGLKEGRIEGMQQGIQQGKIAGIKEGRTQGEATGAQNMLLSFLQHRYGNLPDSLISSISSIIDSQKLQVLSQSIWQANSLQQVLALLKGEERTQIA